MRGGRGGFEGGSGGPVSNKPLTRLFLPQETRIALPGYYFLRLLFEVILDNEKVIFWSLKCELLGCKEPKNRLSIRK